ncbi:MAG: FixH family protein [Vicinamibacteraceae bacterium]
MSQPRRLHWGVGVAAAYGLFASSTLGFVAFAMTQPVELVSVDYYRRSLVEDAKLEATRHADLLGATLACRLSADGRALVIGLPRTQAATATGTVTLYRPSSVAADRTVALALDNVGEQRLALAGLAPGRWILQLDWQAEGRRYHHEQPVRVP